MPRTILQPTQVRAPLGARILEIDWDSGATTQHQHLILRAFCPCAHCQGHQGVVRWVTPPDGGQALELSLIEEVGHYALRLGWADGHATGIYPYPHFLRLAELEALSPQELEATVLGGLA